MWKPSQKLVTERPAVSCIAWLGLRVEATADEAIHREVGIERALSKGQQKSVRIAKTEVSGIPRLVLRLAFKLRSIVPRSSGNFVDAPGKHRERKADPDPLGMLFARPDFAA